MMIDNNMCAIVDTMYNIDIMYIYIVQCIYIGPPKQDRKQSIKNKNNKSLSFHFDLFSGCWFVRLSFFLIFGFSLISHELLDKTYIYIHIIRTGSMRRLKLCALLSFQRMFLAQLTKMFAKWRRRKFEI